MVIEVLRSSNSTKSPQTKPTTGNCLRDPERDRTSKPIQKGDRDVEQLSHVDHVTTNAHSSQCESQLYIFEDNEAVIKMIIKGRSPTLRHVSRTHRVAQDWLVHRINLGLKIQIKYVDTKNRLADLLTKGNFTCDEWNHLLRLLNIMILSMFSCSHLNNFLSDLIRKQCAMSKRVQESNLKEGSAVAKPKPMNLNFASFRKVPSQEVRDPNSPGNQCLNQHGVSARKWKQIVRATNEGPTMNSQESQQSDTQTSNTVKHGRRDESSNSVRSWKQSARGEVNPFGGGS